MPIGSTIALALLPHILLCGNIIVKANDKKLGIANWTFIMDASGDKGSFDLDTPTYGEQSGIFSKYGYLPATVHASNN